MSSESTAWTALRPVLRSVDPVRIESPGTGSGIPDVNYTQGWIELKYLREWPKRATTRVKIEHYTKEQRAWATQRTLAGGKVFFLLKVGPSEWLLFPGAVAARNVGRWTRAEMSAHATARWLRLPRKEELLPWLVT